jgi:hypothetical protein
METSYPDLGMFLSFSVNQLTKFYVEFLFEFDKYDVLFVHFLDNNVQFFKEIFFNFMESSLNVCSVETFENKSM